MNTPKKKKSKSFVITPTNDSSKQSSLFDFFQKKTTPGENLQTNNFLQKATSSTCKPRSSGENYLLEPPEFIDSESSTTSDAILNFQLSDIEIGVLNKTTDEKSTSNLQFNSEFIQGTTSNEISLDNLNVKSESSNMLLFSENFSSPQACNDLYDSLTEKRRLSLDASSDLELYPESISLKSIDCPFCGKLISHDWVDLISELYEMILQYFPPVVKNKQRQIKNKSFEMKIQFINDNKYNSFLYKNFQERMAVHREFCKKHYEKSLMEKAYTEGWPSKNQICLDELNSRLENFRFMFEQLLFGVPSPLSFLKNEIFNEFYKLGAHAFRSRKHLASLLQRIRVGYYGLKGQKLMTEQLHKMYLDKEDFPLDIFQPLRKVEYIQLILVPAAGVLLIREDLMEKSESEVQVKYEDAYEFMKLTSDYGEFITPNS